MLKVIFEKEKIFFLNMLKITSKNENLLNNHLGN